MGRGNKEGKEEGEISVEVTVSELGRTGRKLGK